MDLLKRIFLILCLFFYSFTAFSQNNHLNDYDASMPPPLNQLSDFGVISNEMLDEKQQQLANDSTLIDDSKLKLNQAEKSLSTAINDLSVNGVDDSLLEKSNLEQKTAQLNLDKLTLDLNNLESSLNEQNQTLINQRAQFEHFKHNPPKEDAALVDFNNKLTEFKRNLSIRETSIGLDELRRDNLKKLIELADRYLTVKNHWLDAVNNAYKTQQRQILEQRIQQERQNYLNKANELRKQLLTLGNTGSQSSQRFWVEAQIQDAESRAQYVANERKLTYYKEQIEQITVTLKQSPQQLNRDNAETVHQTFSEITQLKLTLDGQLNLIEQQLKILDSQTQTLSADKRYAKQSRDIFSQLKEDLAKQLDTATRLIEDNASLPSEVERIYQNNFYKKLLERRQLPDDLTGWQLLWNDIASTPSMFFKQEKVILQGVINSLQQLSVQHWILLSLSVVLLAGLVIFLRNKINTLIAHLNQKENKTFSMQSAILSLRLLEENLVITALVGFLLLVFWVANPPFSTLLVGMVFGAFLISQKALMDLNHFLLVVEHENYKGLVEDVSLVQRLKLYKQLRWMLLVFGIIVLITVLAHILMIRREVIEIIDTIFMVTLSLTMFPLMRIRNITLQLLTKELSNYWMLVLRITTLMFPFAMLVVALLGVIGYLNLGWYIAWHLVLFIAVFTLWLILRGVLNDIVTLSKRLAMRHSGYGLLWTQDIIPLVEKLAGIALAISSIVLLFWLNRWLDDETVMSFFKTFFDYTLFTLADSPISVGNVILSFITIWMVFWFSGWVKRVTYRWIYTNIVDLGVRNSLSVFTQYVVLLIGLLVTLKVIGINLTTLTVLLGGLGVGIGFGLQNIANNFVSGLLLLIERPLRTGDIVNIGKTFEGTVTHIGMRSVTVQTWDKQDVIVPNSELITNAFTNWTHTDRIVRITVYTQVSYDNDPHQARQLILDLLKAHPEVVKEPAPLVNLWEFADSAFNLRIDFFVDLTHSSTLKMRGAILLAIWDCFKEADIKIPYPQREVYVRQSPENKEDDDAPAAFAAG